MTDRMTDIATTNNTAADADTIAAIATPLGSGGVGIVRISGPRAAELRDRLFVPHRAQSWQSHRMVYGTVHDTAGRLLDEALAVWMQAPHSYTCEDVVELQTHGGPQVLKAVLSAVLAAGARLATPGEFTLRAFLNGRIDLSQAEAVMDVIEAKTQRASAQAAGQLEGRLAEVIHRSEQALTDLLAEITVGVDFPDDEDAPLADRVTAALEEQTEVIENGLLKGAYQGRLAREGVRVALIGAVNVGKSSLLNRLLESDRAIVTALPGTTRDVIEETLEIGGIPFLLVDTAGFRAREEADMVEQIGMQRSRDALTAAQLALLVIDAAAGVDETALQLLEETAGQPRLVLLNKRDAVTEEAAAALKAHLAAAYDLPEEDILALSAKEGTGSEALRQALLRKAGAGLDSEAASPLVSNLRHEQALQQALASLQAAKDAAEAGIPLDMAAIDIEQALVSLGEISGKTASEAVLDAVFSRFCLGK